jgi:hypothetical protein
MDRLVGFDSALYRMLVLVASGYVPDMYGICTGNEGFYYCGDSISPLSYCL